MDQKLKKDKGKLRYDLIPWEAEEAMAKALTLGISKGYIEDSWKNVEKKRYMAALRRHFRDYLKGVEYDEDALNYDLKIRPIELVIMNAAFLLWKEINDGR